MSVKAILVGQQKSYTKAEEDALLATKQNTLTFDSTPTSGSTNPATSGGIATALDGKQDNLTIVGTIENSTAIPTAAAVKTYADNIRTLDQQDLDKQIIYCPSVACSATTGNFAIIQHPSFTTNSVVLECVFANSAAIMTDVTWTSSSGQIVFNGTCSTATTANVVVGLAGTVIT